MAKRGLGKGLGALLEDDINELVEDNSNTGDKIKEIDIMLIDRQLEQPRKYFDEGKLGELAESIKLHGIVQPIIVKKEKGRYLIIAGERRYRAARLAGLKSVPVVEKDLSNQQIMEVSLIENIQREDLNAVEQAQAIRLLMNEHNMTQEQVSERIGKSRSAVANILRLLTLDQEILDMIKSGELSAGHARTLVVAPKDMQLALAKRIIKEGLSVRQAEKLVNKKEETPKAKRPREISPNIADAQYKISGSMGTKVTIMGNENKGKIVIEYYTLEQLQEIYEKLVQYN